MEYKYMVFTKCLTYNHTLFIKDALNGFAIQETNFPVVYSVIDDASTDGTQDELRKWASNNLESSNGEEVVWAEKDFGWRRVAHHKDHPNLLFVIILLKENHFKKKNKFPYFKEWYEHSKYHAICEGDDYWTHPKKLQIQVDYLEAHPDCSLCFHANKFLYPDGKFVEYRPEPCKKSYYPEDIVDKAGGFMATNSMLYRSEFLLKEKKPDFWEHSLIGDLPTMLYMITKGYFGYHDEFMSVYRYMAKGSWSERDKNATLGDLIYKHRHNVVMYKEYNEYTDGKYKSIIKKRVKRNKHVFYIRVIKTMFHSVVGIFK